MTVLGPIHKKHSAQILLTLRKQQFFCYSLGYLPKFQYFGVNVCLRLAYITHTYQSTPPAWDMLSIRRKLNDTAFRNNKYSSLLLVYGNIIKVALRIIAKRRCRVTDLYTRLI